MLDLCILQKISKVNRIGEKADEVALWSETVDLLKEYLPFMWTDQMKFLGFYSWLMTQKHEEAKKYFSFKTPAKE